MNRSMVAGGVVTALGIAGYGVGIAVAYPGRAFSLAALMVGITMVLVGRDQGAHEE